MRRPDNHDDPVNRALASLARETASDQFTHRVLAALDGRSRPTLLPRPALGWAAAGTALLTIVLVLGLAWQRQQAAELAYRQQVEELRNEYERLLRDVASVRREASVPPTLLYLGGDDQVDLVLDLGDMGPFAAAGELLPAGQDADTGNQRIRPAILDR